MQRKTKKQQKLSRTSASLLENFSDAAQSHGWNSDQGSREDAVQAKAVFENAHAALYARLLSLEARLRTERERQREPSARE